MRCKNCGSENEDGRYICQNCGSPLYDEGDEFIENGEYDAFDEEAYGKQATKKSIIIIAILVVVLVAIITGVIVAASTLGGNKDAETSESDTISTSEEYSENENNNFFTDETTEQITEKTTEKTTKPTTEKTTTTTEKKTTTTTTTKPVESKFKVSVDVDGDGNILGEGEYSKGKRVTLVATENPGSVFVGWYENGVIVASGSKYSFTVDKERHLTALFQKAPEEISSNEPAEAE